LKTFDSSLNSSQERVLSVFKECASEGWMRFIDWACASTFVQLSPDTSSAPVLMAVCMLSRFEGLGHTCLPLKALYQWRSALGQDFEAWSSLSLLMPQTEHEWLQALESSALIRHDAADWSVSKEQLFESAPVVWERWSAEPSLYFRRHWISDFLVAKSLIDRSRMRVPYDPEKLKHYLSLLFPSATEFVDWQQLACAMSIRSGLTFVTGGPGTGKTYTVARILALMFALQEKPSSIKVALAAPTGKAATRLLRSIQNAMGPIQSQLMGQVDIEREVANLTQAHTLHSLLGASADGSRFKFNAKNPLDASVLIVDEASMVNLEMMSSLMQALDARTQLIFLGDPDQLAAVEAGSVLADLCQPKREMQELPQLNPYSSQLLAELKSVMDLPDNFSPALNNPSPDGLVLADHIVHLKRSRRFEGPIASLAELIKAADLKALASWMSDENHTDGAVQIKKYPQAKGVVDESLSSLGDELRERRPNFYDYLHQLCEWIQAAKNTSNHTPFVPPQDWVKALLLEFDRYRVLCAVNEGPMGSKHINQAIEEKVLSDFELPKFGEWYAGRPVMVTHNQHDLGLSNGDVGLVLPERLGAPALKAYFMSGDDLRVFSLARLVNVQTSYAMSIHKSQGSEYEHTLLVLPQHMDQALSKELLYTGVTRAKKYLTVVQESEGLVAKAISQVANRSSGLSAHIKRLKQHLEGASSQDPRDLASG
jgi:exodeoxyribonuclease V alpha subunit